METTDFFAQSRAAQDRLVDAANGRPPPALLAYAPLPDRKLRGLLALCAVALVSTLVLAAIGYGSLTSRFALSPPWLAAVEAALLATAAVAFALAILGKRRRARLPYRSGIYLFPGVLVVARGRHLQALPLDQLASVRAAGARLDLAFVGNRSFSFKLGDAEAASRGPELLDAHRQAVAEARQAGDARALARMDPLKDPGIASPLAPTVPRAAPAVAGAPALIGGALLGAAAGLGLWYGRNRGSAAALYERARAQNTVAAYQQYLARGGKRPDVAHLLLPRAELERARKTHTVDALERFIHQHPGSPVLSEAHAALKALMVSRVTKLSGVGHLAALRALAGDPHADLVKVEIHRAILADYQSELSRYEKHASGANAAGRRCVRSLLHYASEHGPSVEVRYVAHASDFSMADLAVKQSPYFPGTKAIPSQYFDDAASSKRYLEGAQRLVLSLQRAFPRDVLHFRIGKPLDPGDKPIVKLPTLVLDYTTALSGMYANPSPPTVLVGLSLRLETLCALPGARTFSIARQAAWDPPTHESLESGDPPAQIYDETIKKRYGVFDQHVLALLGLARR